MKKTRALLLGAVPVLLASACGKTGSYMPLEVGNTWTYSVEVLETRAGATIDDRTDERVVEVTACVDSPEHGKLFELTKTSGSSGYSYSYCFTWRDSTLMAFESPQSYVGETYLQLPCGQGATWVTTRRSNPAIDVSVMVVATDVTVRTPAGSFDGCVRVRSECQLDANLQVPGREHFTYEYWWAPGVGYVRQVSLTENQLQEYSQSRTEELVEYSLR